MSAVKVAATSLIVAGALSLFYGTFVHTRETRTEQQGALEPTPKDRKAANIQGWVNIPGWVGVVALVAGGLFPVVPRRQS
jgi:hypothetical protein